MHEGPEGITLNPVTSHGRRLRAAGVLELVHTRLVELLEINVFKASNALLRTSSSSSRHAYVLLGILPTAG